MTINPYVRRRNATKRQLLEAGLSLLLEKGYDKVTITEITDRADYGRGTFYEYFADKEDMFEKLLETLFSQGIDNVNASVSDLPSPQREYYGWVHTFSIIENYRDLFSKLRGRDYAHLIERFIQYMVVHIEYILEQGIYAYGDMLQLPNRVMAHFVAGAFYEVMIYWLGDDCDLSAEAIAGMFFKMLYHLNPPEASLK